MGILLQPYACAADEAKVRGWTRVVLGGAGLRFVDASRYASKKCAYAFARLKRTDERKRELL